MSDKITQFDKTNLKEVRAVINAALSEQLEKLGLTAKIGNITFSDADFRCKLEVSCGSTDDAARREWDKHAFLFGLTSEDFGKTFVHGGTAFTICGIKPKSRKFPVLAKNANGTTYKFPVAAVK